MELNELITEFSKTRPDSNVIIGYGSKVKSQANDKGMKKQIDLIFGVDDVMKWHKLNHEINPSDYKSEIGYKLFPFYENIGTKINYLSYLPFEDQMFKIGVVNTTDLINDLINWDNFFLAGRCQKPIEIIKGNAKLDDIIKINRMNALKTALLATGKSNISEKELYEILCSLSFVGDWRQLLHIETKNKVKNIVEGSFDELHDIYSQVNNGYFSEDNNKLIINYETIISELNTLPENLKIKVLEQLYNQMFYGRTDSEILKKVKETIIKHFTIINLKASAAQPIKGIMLNGFSKSITYVYQKMAKK